MFCWFSRKKPNTKPLPTSVRLDGEAVRVFANAQEIDSFRWEELEWIRAFKQDCFGVDRIWLMFDKTGCDEPVCIHEEVEGYEALIAEMQRRCAGNGLDEEWWKKVAFPAFRVNHTVVWRQS